MAIRPEEFDMSRSEQAALFEAEGKCSHGTSKGDHCEGCQRTNGEGEVNISAAKEVLNRARTGLAEREEINEMIKTLQGLQNDGIDAPEVRATLAGLIAVRGE